MASFAETQGQRGEGEEPQRQSSEKMIEQATINLNLTDEQVTQWTEIHKKHESSLSDKSKARETRKAMGKELKATLTEDQSEKLKKIRQNLRTLD